MKQVKWYKVADSIDAIQWNQHNLAVAEAGGKMITLARINNQVHACAYKCPHASGVLAEGYIDALGHITCPVHRYKFNLHNGRNVSGEGYFLKIYAVEEREAGIFVGYEVQQWP